jgi:hypothetical protein
MSIIETICTDQTTFTSEQRHELLDQVLVHSTIVRPLSAVDRQRLQTFACSLPCDSNGVEQRLANETRTSTIDVNIGRQVTDNRPCQQEKSRDDQRSSDDKTNRSAATDVDALLAAIDVNFDERLLTILLEFVRTKLNEKVHLEKIVSRLLSTFDSQCLPVKSTVRLTQSLLEHPMLDKQPSKNLLRFLLHLLQLNIHASPKSLLEKINRNPKDAHLHEQVTSFLEHPLGQHAPGKWKTTMVQLLQQLSQQYKDNDRWQHMIRSSPMLKTRTLQDSLKSYWGKTSEQAAGAATSTGMTRLLYDVR